MTHDMSCIRFSLPTEDSSRRRRLSVEILYSSDSDLDKVSSGGDEEEEFEKCAWDLKRLFEQNSGPLEISEEGLSADSLFSREDSGRSPTTARKFLPGRLVALRHSVELTFLRVESNGTIHADRSIARADEVFAVVSLPLHEDTFALRSVGNKKYLRCQGEGQYVYATCEDCSVGESECFMEEDAGENFTAIRSVKYNQFWGGQPVKLFSKIEQNGKYQVLPVSRVF
ncbi:hypothetical protein R1sor_021714 [Riccia sorocarpa]|uniref:Uncharacterized protein n=1 Tax=Riccia sorocarpa TaxID=122646 RepID=A0ABD3GIJ8_9MARC